MLERLELVVIGGLMVVTACGPDAGVTTTQVPGDESTSVSETAETSTSPPPRETTTRAPISPSTSSALASPATSFEEIAGTFEHKDVDGLGFFWISGDGRVRWAAEEGDEQIELNARFDGTSLLLTDHDCGDDLQGEYQFRLLSSGDLEVVLLEDACPGRAGLMPGTYALVD